MIIFLSYIVCLLNSLPPGSRAIDTMSWQESVAQKQRSAAQLLPEKFRLSTSVAESLQHPLETCHNRLIELQISKQSSVLSDKEHAITERYTTAQLLEALASGGLSSREVTTAFCKRSAIAGKLLNCVTESLYEDALKRAEFLDEHLASTGKPFGPLHGLPVSVKDSFKIKGIDSTIGFSALINKPAVKNAALVDVLLQLGAVLYVKTNVPQTMMTADSHNNIWGRTLNPHNTTVTAGGSTGGEGALVAFRGSPLGVGTDVAGSIRIPSLCCGIYGFKPTTGRIPYGGQQSPVKSGYSAIMPAAGPMANSIEAMQIFCEAVTHCNPASYDSTTLAVPWKPIQPLARTTKLNIGVLLEDPLLPLHPPVKRAMTNATAALTKLGHNLIPIAPEASRVSDLAELSTLFFALGSPAASSYLQDSGEPPVPSVAKPGVPVQTPALKSLREKMQGVDEFSKLAALHQVRYELREAWRVLWNELKLDVVISPGAQHTAVKHDTYAYPAYTVFLNVLDVSHDIVSLQGPPSGELLC